MTVHVTDAAKALALREAADWLEADPRRWSREEWGRWADGTELRIISEASRTWREAFHRPALACACAGGAIAYASPDSDTALRTITAFGQHIVDNVTGFAPYAVDGSPNGLRRTVVRFNDGYALQAGDVIRELRRAADRLDALAAAA